MPSRPQHGEWYNESMVRIIEAIYADGVLRPVGELRLPDQQRVRLTVEVIDGARTADRDSALARLLAHIERDQFSYGGPLPTRDELHDRV